MIKCVISKTITPGESNILTKADFNYSGDINEIYQLLEIDLFTIVERKIGKNYYSIYCDDEALLKDGPKTPATILTDPNGKIYEVIYGSILICKHNEDGDMTSLTEEEQNEILHNLRLIQDNRNYQEYIVINTSIF